jgi:predicted transposase YdaD
LADRLPNLSKQELNQMTSLVRDISHTRFYKEVTEEGKVDGKIEQLKEMLGEGAISQEYYDRKMKGLLEAKKS